MRVTKTERSYNYKLRATWLTPDVIRAAARLEQLNKALSADQTRRLVEQAENAAEIAMLVEIDPREGSGVIPRDWIATLSARAPDGKPRRTVLGENVPALAKVPALAGTERRDYAYDAFWVVFRTRTPDGELIFGPDDLEAELSVRIYDKTGRVRWSIPQSVRARLQSASR